jgi:phosphatidylserine decarboxylase
VKFSRTHLPFLGLFWRYGGPIRWFAFTLAGLAFIAFFFSTPLGLSLTISLILLFSFFRCPDCLNLGENLLVSPATGRIDDLEKMTDCPGIGEPGTRIGIFLSVFDVHVTCAPVSGRIRSKQFVPGRFGNAMSRSIGSVNQRNEILLETGTGKLLFMRQISGVIARRVVFEPIPGDQVQAGAIVGMIRFGSRVELFVPENSGFQICARLGDRVIAGTTEIGRISTSPNS